MWVRFTEDFDYSPASLGGRVTTAFKAGMVKNVTRECAVLALAARRAVRASRPQIKEDRNGDADRSR